MKACKIAIVLLALIGLVCSIIYGIRTGVQRDLFGVVGAISTILSIVLAVASIWYGYKTNCETQQLLEDINDQNEKLVRKINKELSRDNFNEENVKIIRESLSGRRE